MITLKCGCKIDEKGRFILSDRCKYCEECNIMVELHPFGNKRIKDFLKD
ncbi:hypothetical protein J4221_01665 [Candidatus Pacearchaeota archaeon]|nr:hypothetical protein [Candidatus Pacearchaeota archaeon]